MANLWNTKPSKLGFKFSEETIKKLKDSEFKIHHKECRKFRVGGIARDFKGLVRNRPQDKRKCHPDCKNK